MSKIRLHGIASFLYFIIRKRYEDASPRETMSARITTPESAKSTFFAVYQRPFGTKSIANSIGMITGNKKAMINIKRDARLLVQSLFLLLVLWLGYDFFQFVMNDEVLHRRPPGVEAFLPISAFISLRYWLYSGILNGIHPAGVILLLFFIFISLIFKKGFCGWICPIGFFSEWLQKLHKAIVAWLGFRHGSRLKMPSFLDWPLRFLKYLLLFYFLYAIFWAMTPHDVRTFLYSPYNRVADIKMLYFFTRMSAETRWALLILVGLSLLIPFFWCRYLCPYGALMGLLSMASPFKIRRNAQQCTLCQSCTRICPANIKVHTLKTVISDECIGCQQCVQSCKGPSATLFFALPQNRFQLRPIAHGALIVALFVTVYAIAQLSGFWHNKISYEEYRFHKKYIDRPLYLHHRGKVAPYEEKILRSYGFFFDDEPEGNSDEK